MEISKYKTEKTDGADFPGAGISIRKADENTSWFQRINVFGYDVADAESMRDLVMAGLEKVTDPRIGKPVKKRGGDYEFDGVIVDVIKKRSGAERFVVEDERGLLLIMNEKQALG